MTKSRRLLLHPRQFVELYFTLKFRKRRQLFLRPQYETLSVAAMCVNNPDRSCFEIQR